MPKKDDGLTQIYMRVDPKARELLRTFADEDKRALAREFEFLMEEEAKRRMSGASPFTVAAGDVAFGS